MCSLPLPQDKSFQMYEGKLVYMAGIFLTPAMGFPWEDLMGAQIRVMSDATGFLDLGVYFREHWCAEDWLRTSSRMVWSRTSPSSNSS